MPLIYSEYRDKIESRTKFDFQATKSEVGLSNIDSLLGKEISPTLLDNKSIVIILARGSEFDKIYTKATIQGGRISLTKKLANGDYHFSVKF